MGTPKPEHSRGLNVIHVLFTVFEAVRMLKVRKAMDCCSIITREWVFIL